MEFKGVCPAYREFCKMMRLRGFITDETSYLNENRYIISNFRFPTDSEQIFIKLMFIFKRDTFHSFGQRFGLGRKEGESINEDDFKLALNKGVKKIYFFYPSGKIYSISTFELYEYGNFWKCEEGKFMRSVPFEMLKFEGGV